MKGRGEISNLNATVKTVIVLSGFFHQWLVDSWMKIEQISGSPALNNDVTL